jgi:hypothetical protein
MHSNHRTSITHLGFVLSRGLSFSELTRGLFSVGHNLSTLNVFKINKYLDLSLDVDFFEALNKIKLHILNISNTYFSYLRPGFGKFLPDLQVLNMSHNNFWTFDETYMDILKLTSLHVIDLSYYYFNRNRNQRSINDFAYYEDEQEKGRQHLPANIHELDLNNMYDGPSFKRVAEGSISCVNCKLERLEMRQRQQVVLNYTLFGFDIVCVIWIYRTVYSSIRLLVCLNTCPH